MTATFYSGFSKRKNSTKQPSGGTAFNVVLKENTSLMRPAFLVSSVNWSWNYASAFGNYYYITDIVAESNNTFRVECALDEMATFKGAIGAYSTLIARASADQNYNVIDTIYPAKAVPTTKRTQISNSGLFTTDFSAGCIVFGTIGQYGQNFYVCTPSRFASLCAWLFPTLQGIGGGQLDLGTWLNMEVSQAVVGGLNNIMQCVTLLKWLPINFSAISSMLTGVSSVHIGNWTVSHNMDKVNGSVSAQVLSINISFPDRDDGGARGKWLYQAPFANYSVYIPPFGMIQLDPAYMFGAGRQLTADIMADIITGAVTLRMYYALGNGGIKMVGVYNANVGFDMKAGGGVASIGGMMSGIVQSVAGMINDSSQNVIGGIATAVQSAMPQTAQIGGGVSGPTPDIASNWFAYATYFDPIDENRSEVGRPLGEIKQIGSLTGYIKCADAQLAIAGHEEEMSKINQILTSGFFYE